MERKIRAFIQKLAKTQTGSKLFNPYNELYTDVDDRTAPGVRQQNLRLYLKTHAKLNTKYLWVYGAPSYVRSTRSGIPLLNSTMFDQVENTLDT